MAPSGRECAGDGGGCGAAFIRTSGEFDGFVDFDAATRDPADPTRLQAAYDGGDGLHPNDAGSHAMGHAADLDTLRCD